MNAVDLINLGKIASCELPVDGGGVSQSLTTGSLPEDVSPPEEVPGGGPLDELLPGGGKLLLLLGGSDDEPESRGGLTREDELLEVLATLESLLLMIR